MPLPNKYELDSVVLPEIRRSIMDMGTPLTQSQEALQSTLFSLLALVHDLADEVQTLQAHVRYLQSQ